MPDINFTTNGISITKIFENIRKANGPEKMPIRFLKYYADDISKLKKKSSCKILTIPMIFPRIGSQQMSYRFFKRGINLALNY